MKEQYKDLALTQRISHIRFGMFAAHEMRQLSHITIVNRELYQPPDRQPTPYGVLDRRLGTSDKVSTCTTCGLKLADCVGHFGDIELELPVYHIGYFKAILTVLQNICKTCSRVLLTDEERSIFSKKLRNTSLEMLQRRAVHKSVNERCRRMNICVRCGAFNGLVKKIGALKIVHEKYKRAKKDERDRDTDAYLRDREKERFRLAKEFEADLHDAVDKNPDIKMYITNAQEDINPLMCVRLFERISDEDCVLLDMHPDVGRPERLILTRLLVPPVCIRPSVTMESASGSNEDDLTIKLAQILHANSMIKKNKEIGANVSLFMDEWDLLQLQCAYYINSELTGVPLSVAQKLQNSKQVRGFCQRLKGKTGRFRGNLSGKRVDFSSRTVISPDPNLRIDQVAIPMHVAQTLTYPERVCDHNLKHMQELVINGVNAYPGANQIWCHRAKGATRTKPIQFDLKFVKDADRKRKAKELKNGDLVERHLVEGDYVLFNRQPSLHKLSIMCHQVKISPNKTFSFNECVCTPYNADFDGDEMNLHVPQTEEARAEAAILMNVKSNIVTPRNGEPLISAIQDFITGAYILSNKDRFFNRAQFVQLCTYLGDGLEHIDLPPPSIYKPCRLWTGKQVFSLLLRPNKKSNIVLNLRTPSRSYSKKDEEMCHKDGFVCIRNSEHICGILDKGTLGSGSKATVYHVLLRDFGQEAAAQAMSRLAKVIPRFLTNFGFSIGIEDVTPGVALLKEKERCILESYQACDKFIEAFHSRQLEPQPGCTLDETLEACINGELGKIRQHMGEVCIAELPRLNSPLAMALCGSKGSNLNIAQMIACVGQQSVGGARIPNGFESRTLPHFSKNSRKPDAKGFVKNSFYSGLLPTEFFFHTICGREGLVDTAVKTAETGYMQRRLMKALEDLSVRYDDTVRNSMDVIIQFKFGEDGLDPASMEGADKPVDFGRVLSHVLASTMREEKDSQDDWSMLNTVVGPENPEDQVLAAGRSFVDENFARDTEANVGYRDSLPKKKYISSFADDLMDFISKSPKAMMGVKKKPFKRFLDVCHQKFKFSVVEPGTAVGGIAAQSIGEPGTQMTLKTFHFAGVASMNITLGVPRIKEIINASKSISTPIIEAPLEECDSVDQARLVKGRIEKTTLGEVCEYIQEVFTASSVYLKIKLHASRINLLKLEITANDVRSALLRTPKLKLKNEHISILDSWTVKVSCYNDEDDSKRKEKKSVFFTVQKLKQAIPEIMVKGIATVRRAVISREGNDKQLKLVVEGEDLRSVMSTRGVVGVKATSNHIIEVEKTLGIEAARATIMKEIQHTMSHHGMHIDTRHVMLLADLMTFKGDVLGITRFGIAKMKESVLMLASFEKTTDYLFDASIHGQKDAVSGVSECIIMGIPMSLGTGMFKLLQNADENASNASIVKLPLRPLLFDTTPLPSL